MAITFEPVRARKRDPETSQRAASKVREFAANHYNRIAAALRLGPATYVEIAERAGLERHAVARRLGEMAHLGVTRIQDGCDERGEPIYRKRDGMALWRIA